MADKRKCNRCGHEAMYHRDLNVRDPFENESEGTQVEIDCDCGKEHIATVRGEVGQMLEWFCPAENKLKRDTNA